MIVVDPFQLSVLVYSKYCEGKHLKVWFFVFFSMIGVLYDYNPYN